MSRASQENLWSEIRVGVVALTALVILVAGVILAGGDKGLLFKKKSYVKALMSNVGGLKTGSSVTMNGMIIGRVTNIAFATGAPVTTPIEVTMEIRSDLRPKIKTDSVPAIRTQGMMGDRYVDISSGGEEQASLEEGQSLTGMGSSDFDQTLREALIVLSETEKLLKSINQQEGTVGRFFYDERFYENLAKITDEMNSLIQDFKKRPRRYVKFSLF